MEPPPAATCVLLSGGVDSAVVLAAVQDRPTSAVWVDYGQPAAKAERAASEAIAAHYACRWTPLQVGGLSSAGVGEVPGRNDLLVAAAAVVAPGCAVAIGIHAGSGYADCTPTWASAWQDLLDVQHAGRVRLIAPLIDLTKQEVYAIAYERGVPLELTYSCEASAAPCGSCSSCADRRLLDAPA